MYHVSAGVCRGQKRASGPLLPGVIGGYEPPYRCQRPNHLLEEVLLVFLTTELISPAPRKLFCYIYITFLLLLVINTHICAHTHTLLEIFCFFSHTTETKVSIFPIVVKAV